MSDPAVGLVTNLVVGEGSGLGALLEALHLNSFVAAASLGELLLNPVLWITLATLLLCATGPALDLRLLAIAAAGIAVKCASDSLVCRRLRGKLPRIAEILLMPLKDLAVGAIWLI